MLDSSILELIIQFLGHGTLRIFKKDIRPDSAWITLIGCVVAALLFSLGIFIITHVFYIIKWWNDFYFWLF